MLVTAILRAQGRSWCSHESLAVATYCFKVEIARDTPIHYGDMNGPVNNGVPDGFCRVPRSTRLLLRCWIVEASALVSLAVAFSAFSESAFNLKEIERPRILPQAAVYLESKPITVTAAHCPRSAGGLHDFFSEGDYWWPDPKNPEGPYIQRDGLSNRDNFSEHRHAMIRLSSIVGTLTSAYLLTREDRYAKAAVKHLKAWFVDEETKMNPHLLFGQAIKGKATGRSTGVIDTIHLVEVARSALVLGQSSAIAPEDFKAVKAWFGSYLSWLTTHPYGTEERAARNNHAVCWALQAAGFAKLTGNEELLASIRNQFKMEFVGKQMALDGSFPAELRRTKPYGYSLFVLDAMAGVAQIASTPQDDLWLFTLPDGRGMRKAMDFLFPYIKDKAKWPGNHDVLYWDKWPVRQPCLLFAGNKFQNDDYLGVWQKLEADPQTPEVVRNLPLRYPLLWFGGTNLQSTRARGYNGSK